MSIFYLIVKFWCYHPALLYGISLLLGIYSALYPFIFVFFPLFLLWFPFLVLIYQKQKEPLKTLFLSLGAFFASWLYLFAHYQLPDLPEKGLEGVAHITVNSLTTQSSPFGTRWMYHCHLHNFFPSITTNSRVQQAKCLIALPLKEEVQRPAANQDYIIKGRLIQTEQNAYLLKISLSEPWLPVKDSWSWAEQRYHWKKNVKKWIQDQFSYALNGTFLAALATGEMDDQWIRQEFSRFGLQHILAISGFHFAIIAAFLSFLMRLFFPRRVSAILLLLSMAGYCFFLGSTASVLRAWLMSSLTATSLLIEKRSLALNSLGIALMGIIAIDPLLTQTLGFQLSFMTTAAILLVYGPAHYVFKELIPKRPLSEVIEMNVWNQHGYCLIDFFRQGLALTFAVNLFAIPLTLYYFHQFPLMGLFYNLFFPFLITGSLGLLLLGTLFYWIPFIGEGIRALNNIYTNNVLQLTYQLPKSIDHYWSIETFPTEWLIVYLSVITLVCITLKSYIEDKDDKDDKDDFAFI